MTTTENIQTVPLRLPEPLLPIHVVLAFEGLARRTVNINRRHLSTMHPERAAQIVAEVNACLEVAAAHDGPSQESRRIRKALQAFEVRAAQA